MRARLSTGRTVGLRVRCAAGRGVRPTPPIHEATPAATQVKRSRRYIASHCPLDAVFFGGRVMVTGCASVKSSRVSDCTLTS